MDFKPAERIVNAVLYEGYILYPYRASAVKNRQRFNFGVLAPRAQGQVPRDGEDWQMQTEGLIRGDGRTAIEVRLRFLHLVAREIRARAADAESGWRAVESMEVDGKLYQTWQEAVEREVTARVNPCELLAQPQRLSFSFPVQQETEPLGDAGVLLRQQQPINGELEFAATRPAARVFKISIRIRNLTPMSEAERRDTEQARNQELMRSLVSAHTVLGASDGEFVSLLEPPDEFRDLAAECHNVGTWPVLVGAEGERNLMLSSPIIMYDYPQVAPESAGDFFDGAEIDEMLTLRVLTLTDAEKREMSSVDERARQILERTESLPAEQLMKLHGAMRETVRSRER
jgi:hydrogenase maturation protease